MSSKFFRSVVETGLKLNEKEWTKDFIESCKTEMPEDAAENTYFYALSLFEFAAKNYEKALELLSKVKYNDIYHKTEVRCLITEIYYELNMEDALASHLDSFRHFITNDKLIAEDRKEYFSNFVKYARNLSSLKNKKSVLDVYILKRKVEEETVLYNKDWILEKINELEAVA
jgi:tetratricopeptide (TPR) repeat protein